MKWGWILSLWCPEVKFGNYPHHNALRLSKQLGDSATYRTITAANMETSKCPSLKTPGSDSDKVKNLTIFSLLFSRKLGQVVWPRPCLKGLFIALWFQKTNKQKSTPLYNVHHIGVLGHNIAACSYILCFLFYPIILQDYNTTRQSSWRTFPL